MGLNTILPDIVFEPVSLWCPKPLSLIPPLPFVIASLLPVIRLVRLREEKPCGRPSKCGSLHFSAVLASLA